MSLQRIDLRKSPFDLGTFTGRIKYFAWITDPRLSFASKTQLFAARDLLNAYRQNAEPPGTTIKQVYRAQQLYLSSFHPDSGELQNFAGRMSFQVPGGMVLIGAMITFYKSNAAVIFWQWTNQSFNAFVNYTNRNAASDISTSRLAMAYGSATSCAVAVALGFKKYFSTGSNPIMLRFAPFAAVSAANAVNLPLMRQSELVDGVLLYDDNNRPVTQSKYAAAKGISQVVLARIFMAAPSMTLLPLLMDKLEKTHFFRRFGWMGGFSQVFLSGLMLLVTVPVGCAIFPQQCSISIDKLKLDSREMEELRARYPGGLPSKLYFNKGL